MYIERKYTKFQPNWSKGSIQPVRPKFWVILNCNCQFSIEHNSRMLIYLITQFTTTFFNQCRKFFSTLIKTMSRLQLSSKCHPGVLEDKIVPDALTEYIIYFKIVFKTNPESFIQFWHEKPCQDSTYPPSLNFGGLDDRVILTPEVASGVSFKNIPGDRHSLVVFPGHLEPPVMRYHIWTCQFLDFKKWALTQ